MALSSHRDRSLKLSSHVISFYLLGKRYRTVHSKPMMNPSGQALLDAEILYSRFRVILGWHQFPNFSEDIPAFKAPITDIPTGDCRRASNADFALAGKQPPQGGGRLLPHPIPLYPMELLGDPLPYGTRPAFSERHRSHGTHSRGLRPPGMARCRENAYPRSGVLVYFSWIVGMSITWHTDVERKNHAKQETAQNITSKHYMRTRGGRKFWNIRGLQCKQSWCKNACHQERVVHFSIDTISRQ